MKSYGEQFERYVGERICYTVRYWPLQYKGPELSKLCVFDCFLMARSIMSAPMFLYNTTCSHFFFAIEIVISPTSFSRDTWVGEL